MQIHIGSTCSSLNQFIDFHIKDQADWQKPIETLAGCKVESLVSILETMTKASVQALDSIKQLKIEGDLRDMHLSRSLIGEIVTLNFIKSESKYLNLEVLYKLKEGPKNKPDLCLSLQSLSLEMRLDPSQAFQIEKWAGLSTLFKPSLIRVILQRVSLIDVYKGQFDFLKIIEDLKELPIKIEKGYKNYWLYNSREDIEGIKQLVSRVHTLFQYSTLRVDLPNDKLAPLFNKAQSLSVWHLINGFKMEHPDLYQRFKELFIDLINKT